MDDNEKKEGQKPKLSIEEEDRKDLYDAINDLKPEEANDNIKLKLMSLSEINIELKKLDNDNKGPEYEKIKDGYDKKYQIIYDKMADIVKSSEKIEISPEDYDKYGINQDDQSPPSEISDYWLKVVKNSRYFFISEKDEQILKNLKKVELVKFKDKLNDFRVDFIFCENEFCNTEILSKNYIYDKDGVFEKAKGTEINWKSNDKNPTKGIVHKKIRRGKRFIHQDKEENVESFFDFFNKLDDLTYLADEAYFFKDEFFPNQLEYYLDIASKLKSKNDNDENDLDDDEQEQEYENNNKKEECKNQ